MKNRSRILKAIIIVVLTIMIVFILSLVFYKPVEAPKTEEPKAECIISGCNSEICSDEQLSSTCEFREEYACYRTATCELQANGQCGWTQTESLKSCLGINLDLENQ